MGDLRRLKRLLAQGTPLNIQYTLFDKSYSLLDWAAIHGHLPLVKYLLGQGLPRGRSLFCAAEEGHLNVVKYLLSQGGLQEKQERKNPHGETALMRAARFGYADIVKVLLEHGASATAKNRDGETAADVARKKEHEDVLAVVEQHGASASVRGSGGSRR